MTPKWQFSSRFRRNAFGWKDGPALERLKEAVSEIKAAAKYDPILGAEGAVLLLEKLSPALMQVDSSSGRLPSQVNVAIDIMVGILTKAKPQSSVAQYNVWLERLWQAVVDDEMPYLEHLSERWGDACGSAETAADWAVRLPVGARMYSSTSACLSCLFVASLDERLFQEIANCDFQWWPYRRWGAMALARAGKLEEAIAYAETPTGVNHPTAQIAEFCESVLLEAGYVEQAYERYALKVPEKTTYLATFKAIRKKYPKVASERILDDLVASQPGKEGKWFAAAKDAGLYDAALNLARIGGTDSRTLVRASREHAQSLPDFAAETALLALKGFANGMAYEFDADDILEALAATAGAAKSLGWSTEARDAQVDQAVAGASKFHRYVQQVVNHWKATEMRK